MGGTLVDVVLSDSVFFLFCKLEDSYLFLFVCQMVNFKFILTVHFLGMVTSLPPSLLQLIAEFTALLHLESVRHLL